MSTARSHPAPLSAAVPAPSGPAPRARRGGDLLRAVVGAMVVLHGLVHLVGLLGTPDGTRAAPAGLWAAAAVLVVVSGIGLGAGVRRWWWLGAPAVVLSQALVVVSWPQAFAGTVANLVLALAVLHGWRAEGRAGARERYRRRAAEVSRSAVPGPVVTEADLLGLPRPAARWLRRSGAVGRPRPAAFAARMHGRIRQAPGSPWMTFVAEQVNTVGDGVATTRWFRMDATMHGLPVDVLHVYQDGVASMRGRLASVLPVVDVDGTALARAETVTVLNDLCVLAPAALLGAPVTWTDLDEHHVGIELSCGGHRVGATLVLDDDGDLVDFRSADRARSDGRVVEPMPWSTPLSGHRNAGSGRVAGTGAAVWHAPEGAYAYLEMAIDEVTVLPTPEASARHDARLT